MTDNRKKQQRNDAHPGDIDITRRDFAAFLVGAGFAATLQPSAVASLETIEADVEIKTPDGTCDAAFIHGGNSQGRPTAHRDLLYSERRLFSTTDDF